MIEQAVDWPGPHAWYSFWRIRVNRMAHEQERGLAISSGERWQLENMVGQLDLSDHELVRAAQEKLTAQRVAYLLTK